MRRTAPFALLFCAWVAACSTTSGGNGPEPDASVDAPVVDAESLADVTSACTLAHGRCYYEDFCPIGTSRDDSAEHACPARAATPAHCCIAVPASDAAADAADAADDAAQPDAAPSDATSLDAPGDVIDDATDATDAADATDGAAAADAEDAG